MITPEEISAIKLAWIYDGDDNDTVDSVLSGFDSRNSIDALTDRLLAVEQDMSDVSRRVGIYSKLEKALTEYSITKLHNNGDSQ